MNSINLLKLKKQEKYSCTIILGIVKSLIPFVNNLHHGVWVVAFGDAWIRTLSISIYSLKQNLIDVMIDLFGREMSRIIESLYYSKTGFLDARNGTIDGAREH